MLHFTHCEECLKIGKKLRYDSEYGCPECARRAELRRIERHEPLGHHRLADAPLTVEDWKLVYDFLHDVVQPFYATIAKRSYERESGNA